MKLSARIDEDSADRMRRLRVSLGLNQKDMAVHIGVSYTTWNNWEKGYPIPRDGAQQIKRKVPGLDLDWILEGDASSVPPSLRKALGDLPAGS